MTSKKLSASPGFVAQIFYYIQAQILFLALGSGASAPVNAITLLGAFSNKRRYIFCLYVIYSYIFKIQTPSRIIILSQQHHQLC